MLYEVITDKTQKPIRDRMTGNPNRNEPGGGDKKNRYNSLLVPILIAMAVLSIYIVNNGKDPIELEWKQLSEMLVNKEIEKIVVVNQSFAEITIKKQLLDDPKYKEVLNRGMSQFARTGPHYSYKFANAERFEDDILEVQEQAGLEKGEVIRPKGEFRQDLFKDILSWIFPIIILVVIWLIIFRRMSGAVV